MAGIVSQAQHKPDYQRLFESAPGLYLVLDPALKIIAVNDAYANATMTRREQILGKGIFEVFPDNPEDPSAEGVRNLRVSLVRVQQTLQVDAMPVQKYDIRKPTEEGGGFEVRYWSPLNTPVLAADGTLAYIIHRVEDVTEFVRLRQQGIEEGKINDTLRQQALRMETEIFTRAREVAEASAQLKSANETLDRLYHRTRELDELKTRFFANVSHELRTPLTLILGPLSTLARSPSLSGEERNSVRVALRNAQLLHRQVDNLLDIARLDAGRMELRYTRFDLAAFARVFCSNFDTVAIDHHIRFTVACPPQLMIEADLEKCERILLNLLSNAFKFVPDGGKIEVALKPSDAGAELAVRDSGPGVPRDMREAIFERFQQAGARPERHTSGTGLGLAIVREFVTLQRGSIAVTDAPEGGAEFLVTLPVAAPAGVEVGQTEIGEPADEATETVPIPLPEPLAVVAQDAPLVLVIEDNPDMNAFVTRALAQRYRVINAFDGMTGLQLALDMLPALILSDVMMPGLAGDRLVEIVRQHPDLDDTPIVMLTAKADDELRTRLLRHGVQDYIQKPFTTDDLQARIAGLIRERNRVGKRLRSMEARFRATFEQAAVGIAHVAPDGRWLRVNHKLCEIVGYTYDELLSLTFQDITHPDDLSGDIELVGRVLAGDLTSYELEKRYIRKDGQIIWIKLTVSLVRDDEGRAEYFISVIEDIEQRKAAERALSASEERFRQIATTLPETIWLTTGVPPRFAYVSPAFERIWLHACDALLADPHLGDSCIPESDRARAHQAREEAMKANLGYEVEYRIDRPDGTQRWIRECGYPVGTSGEAENPYVGIAHDITEGRQTEEKLRLAATVFDSTNEAIVITEADGEIIAVNRAFQEITGYAETEAIGRNARILRSNRHDPDFYQSQQASLKHTGQWQGEIWNRRKNGELYLCRVTISSVRGPAKQPLRYVAMISDISQMRHNEEQLLHLAHYDSLTELPNRLLLQSRLEHAIRRAERAETQVALLVVNLDQFQTVNDSLGHSVGDQLLIAVANRFRQRTRAEDTLGRLGGDEFLLILESVRRPETAAVVAQDLLAGLDEPFGVSEESEIYVSASIGISIYPDDGSTPSDLLRNADAAMHQGKARGRNGFCFYTAAMNADATQKLALDAAMRKAIERKEFILHYQPKVDLRTGRVCGAEALIRWPRADGVLESPARFVPYAESSGLIVPIGAWVLDEACRQFRAWSEAGVPTFRLAVNLSARQFRSGNLPELLSSVLSSHGLDPSLLELELTESMLMDDPVRTIEVLRAFKRLGVHLSLDDFGTGYSSLGYLSRFPIDALKIDQSFIRDLTTDTESATISAAIIDLAHRMQVRVIAEGVETQEQLSYLRSLECDEIQGYYFSRPLSSTDFETLMLSDRRLPAEKTA